MFIGTGLVRVFTLSAYPLADNTEARYSEIARLMLASGDWITPQLEAGVPFWGKPPLSFWLTATSFKLLGLNEFAARLPAFLLTLLAALLVYRLGRRVLSKDKAIGAAAILITSVIGFIGAGAVMTDASLLLATTLSMVAFWKAAAEQEKRWRYLFFVGLGLGLLAKGPVALVLVGVPVAVWLLYYKNLSWSLKCMPWISGLLVMLVLAAPWYVMAEMKTPGFLEYFLVGEHWLRFIDSGWQGDLYGSAHSQPRGAIWVYGLAAAMPWSVIAIYAATTAWQGKSTIWSLTLFQGYLLLWCLTPLLFFTFAGNILPAYVLPGMPAFALLVSDWLTNRKSAALHAGWLVPMVFVAAPLTTWFDMVSEKSQKDLVSHHRTLSRSVALFYFPKKPFSADFYSQGSAQIIRSDADLMTFLSTPGEEFVAIRRNRLVEIPDEMDACLRTETEYPVYVLMEKRGSGCATTANFIAD